MYIFRLSSAPPPSLSPSSSRNLLYPPPPLFLLLLLLFSLTLHTHKCSTSPSPCYNYQLPTLALLLTATQPTYAACQQHLDFSGDKPRNRSGDLLSCHEHSTRTCCRRHHTEKIALQLASLDDISDNCKRSTEAVWCSICDGEVGEGKFSHSKSTVRLCEAFCQKWYDACRDDYFSPGGPGAASVEPCGLSHLACSRLADS
eukprot:GHVS01014942.1.p1 GENE.GHVS01014942.1~~GHVS01014942.1.p1  ORF type:complete len:201 (-),score=45.08 GHVS01014942.1:116-718(-)